MKFLVHQPGGVRESRIVEAETAQAAAEKFTHQRCHFHSYADPRQDEAPDAEWFLPEVGPFVGVQPARKKQVEDNLIERATGHPAR